MEELFLSSLSGKNLPPEKDRQAHNYCKQIFRRIIFHAITNISQNHFFVNILQLPRQ
jgi:hypothetical protein